VSVFTDHPFTIRASVGIEPGKSFDFDKLDPTVKKARGLEILFQTSAQL
jgi:hypothetical protein